MHREQLRAAALANHLDRLQREHASRQPRPAAPLAPGAGFKFDAVRPIFSAYGAR